MLRQTLTDLLKSIRPEADFGRSRDFIADGMLDSFDMIALVAALDAHYRISVEGVDIVPEHFQSLDSIAALLRKYQVTA
jgi:acyl carrier protein